MEYLPSLSVIDPHEPPLIEIVDPERKSPVSFSVTTPVTSLYCVDWYGLACVMPVAHMKRKIKPRYLALFRNKPLGFVTTKCFECFIITIKI
jgi:hypothetical protein